jgi:hypothetical protein
MLSKEYSTGQIVSTIIDVIQHKQVGYPEEKATSIREKATGMKM